MLIYEKLIAKQTANEFAQELFKDIAKVVDNNGNYLTERDFAAVIVQAIDQFQRNVNDERYVKLP